MRHMWLALVLSLGLAQAGAAQIAWDGPALMGPAAPSGLSLFLANPEPGDGLAVLATWRREAGAVGLGFRGAVGEGVGGDVGVAAGVDVSGMLSRGVEQSEVDVMWWSGVGVGVGDDFFLSVPLGLVVGWTGGDDVLFSPYGGGHASLDVSTVGDDDVDFNVSLDLGIDMVLTSDWVVRFGASIGGKDALALGIRVPSGGGAGN